MAKSPRKSTKKVASTVAPVGGANGIQATTIHDGARYYSRMIRTSEVLGNNNLDPRNLITEFDRWNLVNKARFFVENLPCFKATIEEIATYSVGEAFLPVFQGVDSEWGKKATDLLTKWYDTCDAFGQDMHSILWMASCALDRDGDISMQLTNAADGKYPQINLIPCHRIATTEKVVKEGTFAGYNVFDGIILNDQNRPIGYNIMINDSGSQAFAGYSGGTNNNMGPSIQLSTQNMMMLYEPRYPMQFRGFPTLATCINDLMDYRDVREFEREAIKQAAAISIIEKNPVGGVLPGQYQFGWSSSLAQWQDPSQPIYWKYYNGGSVRYFGSNDPNAGLEQMKNDRPGELTQDFLKNHVLRGAFNSIGWPLEIAWDMSGMNSANTRAILAKVERKLTQRQATLYKMWKRAIIYALAKFIKNGVIEPNPEWYKFTCTYPKSPSIDLGRDAKTEIDLYKLGANTLSDIYGKNGEQFEDKIRQLCKEKQMIKKIAAEYGVEADEIQILYPNPPTEVPEPTGKTNGTED